MGKLICNNFAGIRNVNPSFNELCISASDMQNVELYFTGINNGVGFRTQKGNVKVFDNLIPEDENIINIFESVQNQTRYMFIHTVNAIQGKIYLWYNSQLTLKIDGLSPVAQSVGIDYIQGSRELFVFANGKDKIHYIEMSAIEQTGTIDAVDGEGREIRGLGLANYKGRLWTHVDNRLHYCVTSNVFDWATSDLDVLTSAGFIEFSKKITAICPYLSSIAVFFEDSSVIISDDYPFSASEESPGGCVGNGACVFHGTDLFFYDDVKKGIYSFQQVVVGNKTLGENIALNIREEFEKLDRTRMSDFKAVSVNYDDKNEIWFLLPTSDSHSLIMIYDYRMKEWVRRKSQKINAVTMFDNHLYSAGSNKLYKEYQGRNFSGEYIDAYYKMSAFNGGSFTTLKGFWYSPKICLQEAENNFGVKYIKDLSIFRNSKKKQIKARFKEYMQWNLSNWNELYWYAKDEVKALCKLPNPALFKTLEIEFWAGQENESFNVQSLELSEIQFVQT